MASRHSSSDLHTGKLLLAIGLFLALAVGIGLTWHAIQQAIPDANSLPVLPTEANVEQLTFGVNYMQKQVSEAAEERGLPADTPVIGEVTPQGGQVTFHPPGKEESTLELTRWPAEQVFVRADIYGTPTKITATYTYEVAIYHRYGRKIVSHIMTLSSEPPRESTEATF